MNINRQIIFFTLAFSLTGCATGEKSLSARSDCRALIGRHFAVAEDLYVFKLEGESRLYVGRYYDQPLVGNKNLPREVDASFIGKNLNGNLIVGLVKKGSLLETKDVLNSVSPEGNRILFIVDIQGVDASMWLNVSTFFIQISYDGRNQRLPILNPQSITNY
jgi:hypothetical protein